MGLGKLLYKLFYQPRAYLKRISEVGLANHYSIKSAQKEMIARARLLNERAQIADLAVYTIYFLTGEKYWYQTAFCLYALKKVCSEISIKAIFVDDGSFTNQLTAQMLKQFPSATIISNQQTEDLLDIYLPKESYPAIRKKRLIYPHLRKLTDVHFQPGEWKLVLDSDMLFFKYPEELIKWMQKPIQPFFLYDPVTSYHYSIELMEKLTGHLITEHINVGAAGLNSTDINWDDIERWITELERSEGSSYLLEQALSAMITAGKPVQIAEPNQYIVMPPEQNIKNPDAALHHYVARSKEWYYKTAWRKI